MYGTRAVRFQSGLVSLCRVAPIVSEIVNGVTLMIRLHQQIAIDLRHDGSGGDGDASAIAFDQRNLRHLDRLEPHGVEEEDVGTNGKVFDRMRHGELAGAKDVDAIDGVALDDADGDGARAMQDEAAEREAVFVRDLLGIIDAKKCRLVIEDHAAGDDGTGQAAAAHLVRAGDGAKTKIAEPALDH